MKPIALTLLFILSFICSNAQNESLNRDHIKEDLNNIISDISQSYIYLSDKNVDLDCMRDHYESMIKYLETEEDVVLFFEFLLYEFYDSHLILNTNRDSSFRLFSPFYITYENGRFIVSNVWYSQVNNFEEDIIGAEIKAFNGIEFNEVINGFPTHCNDKSSPIVKEWIANKVIAGRYNEPRVLSLSLNSEQTIEIDVDKIDLKRNEELLSGNIIDNIGYIRINNSLGNNNLIVEFDEVLDDLMNTKALIIDLRNTVDGGNTYVARGLMGRFVSENRPYQEHWTLETYGDSPSIERSWVEYVSPRGEHYKNPVYVLVGRWTGSMGEGIAIGFEGMGRGDVVGTQMQRLAGEMRGYSFKHLNFSYRLSTAKLFHINGGLRENYIPTHYLTQTSSTHDELLQEAINLINEETQGR